MSRYRGPKIRIVRRLGKLPGFTTKRTTRRNLPGQPSQQSFKHKKRSSYSIRLKEKQKLRYNYGLTEKQLLKYVKKAKRLRGPTGIILMQLLEMRLDNIVFRLGIGNTIPASRQIVNHGHIYVNGQKTTIPSFQCHPGDIIEIKSKALFNRLPKTSRFHRVPSYLKFDRKKLKGSITRIAENFDVNIKVNELLIVEYYSRK